MEHRFEKKAFDVSATMWTSRGSLDPFLRRDFFFVKIATTLADAVQTGNENTLNNKL